MQALTADRVHAKNRLVYHRNDLGPQLLERSVRIILAALEAAGRPLTRAELGAALAERGIEATGNRLAHILMYAELECAVCNGPMQGRQHTYLPADDVVPVTPLLDRNEAVLRLARRFFTSRGPATLRDFAWWSGLTRGEAGGVVSALEAELRVDHDLDGTPWFSDPEIPQQAGAAGALLLANADEAVVAYQDLRIAPLCPGVLDPPWDRLVLIDGHAVGRWRRRVTRRTARIEIELVQRLSSTRMGRLDREVRRFSRFLDLEPQLTVRHRDG